MAVNFAVKWPSIMFVFSGFVCCASRERDHPKRWHELNAATRVKVNVEVAPKCDVELRVCSLVARAQNELANEPFECSVRLS